MGKESEFVSEARHEISSWSPTGCVIRLLILTPLQYSLLNTVVCICSFYLIGFPWVLNEAVYISRFASAPGVRHTVNSCHLVSGTLVVIIAIGDIRRGVIFKDRLNTMKVWNSQ